MSTRYDRESAHKLITDINNFNTDVLASSYRVMSYVDNDSDGWQDQQYDTFHENLSSVTDDIINSLFVLRDYRDHLSQKIKELDNV